MKKNKKNYHAGRNSDARLDDKLIIFFHAPYGKQKIETE